MGERNQVNRYILRLGDQTWLNWHYLPPLVRTIDELKDFGYRMKAGADRLIVGRDVYNHLQSRGALTGQMDDTLAFDGDAVGTYYGFDLIVWG